MGAEDSSPGGNASLAIRFCACDRDWADPECRTRRKSQFVAYFLSLFGGYFGFDRFYLGNPIDGMLKLITLGGFGVWWLADIVKIGSAPTYANNFRVSADLPHPVFVVSAVLFFVCVGLFLSIIVARELRKQQLGKKLLAQSEAEWGKCKNAFQVKGHGSRPAASMLLHTPVVKHGALFPAPGYGAIDATAAPQFEMLSRHNPLSQFGIYRAWQSSGYRLPNKYNSQGDLCRGSIPPIDLLHAEGPLPQPLPSVDVTDDRPRVIVLPGSEGELLPSELSGKTCVPNIRASTLPSRSSLSTIQPTPSTILPEPVLIPSMPVPVSIKLISHDLISEQPDSPPCSHDLISEQPDSARSAMTYRE